MPDDIHASLATAAAPVSAAPGENPVAAKEAGLALCLSGGGYRAMLFHVGTILRVNEAGLLARLNRISSVSGGSITAGVLGLHWSRLAFADGVVTNLADEFVAPIRALAGDTIDASAILVGAIGPGSIGDRIAAAYRTHLFGDATLQDLPDAPRFVLNATNVQTGALWRFSKPYMGDFRVGRVVAPTLLLARAVACSSAFPPFLSPVELNVEPGAMQALPGADLHREPFTTKVVLSDGGVYDNLGLETAWKRYDTILVSDAGGGFDAEPDPKHDWAQHSYRILNVVDQQVRNLRKRQVVGSFLAGIRKGAYWGIRTDIQDYGLADALDCPFDRTIALANTPTRLAHLDERLQERLVNWGYAVTDAALRRHVVPDLAAPADFPYPDARI
jgi:NTE family protein